MIRLILIPFIFALFVLPSCNSREDKQQQAGLMVSIGPQEYFLKSLIKDEVPVYTMLPPGASPATYEPSPSEIERLANAIAYFRIGHIGFELGWMDRITEIYPDMPVYDLSEGVPLLSGHRHEDHGDHVHHVEGTDPHIWMSPQRAMIMARNAKDALLELYPDSRDSIEVRYTALSEQIQFLDDTLRQIFNDSARRDFAIFHPSLSYLAEDYGLQQHSIENEGKEPSPVHLDKVLKTIREKEIKTIFIQREFNQEQAKVLADASGAKLVMIEPLSADWPGTILRIAELITKD